MTSSDRDYEALIRFGEMLAGWERDLELPAKFLAQLLDEDDWSFVIKVHSLLEAAVTRALTETLSRAELRDFFARLELSGATIGKLPLAKTLNLLSDVQRKFIRALSELRNDLVHDISQVGFEFETEAVDFSKGRWSSFAAPFKARLGRNPLVPTGRLRKFLLWSECLAILNHLTRASDDALPAASEDFAETFRQHTADEAVRAAHAAARERARTQHKPDRRAGDPDLKLGTGRVTDSGRLWRKLLHAPIEQAHERYRAAFAEAIGWQLRFEPVNATQTWVILLLPDVLNRLEFERAMPFSSEDLRQWVPFDLVMG